MLETASALENLDAVLAVEGLEGVHVGPGDRSLSLETAGLDGGAELRGVLSSSGRALPGVPVGGHAYSGDDETAAHAAEGSTIVMVAVSPGADMAHHPRCGVRGAIRYIRTRLRPRHGAGSAADDRHRWRHRRRGAVAGV
jgi:hypothetical protein